MYISISIDCCVRTSEHLRRTSPTTECVEFRPNTVRVRLLCYNFGTFRSVLQSDETSGLVSARFSVPNVRLSYFWRKCARRTVYTDGGTSPGSAHHLRDDIRYRTMRAPIRDNRETQIDTVRCFDGF